MREPIWTGVPRVGERGRWPLGLRPRAVARSLALFVGALAISLAQPPAATGQEIRPLGQGAWTWFTDPRAIYHEGRHRATYFGYVNLEGSIVVASLDHRSGERRSRTVFPRLGRDDHNNPSLFLRRDGRLVAFFSRHGGGTLYYRISARPEDVTAWGRLRTVPTNYVTYSNPLRVGSRVFLFWRGPGSQPTFSISSDEGATWSRQRRLIRSPVGRPYVKYATNERNKIHLAFTEQNPGSYNTSIYYAAYRPGRREFFSARGESLASLDSGPLRPRQAEKVYDAVAGGARAWIHDVARDGNDRPVIVYVVLGQRHIYRYARWTGSEWQDNELTWTSELGGSDNYSPGLSIDHEDPSVVYLSRRIRGAGWTPGRRSPAEVEVWRTSDGGESWETRAVTSSSTVDNFRPISPRGLPEGGPFEVLWLRGDYPSWGFMRYQTRIFGAP